MTRSIIIGIGGTGLSTIREIRKLIAERYPQALQSPEMSNVKFLYIDADTNDISRRDWLVLGKDINLDQNEIVNITGDRLGGIVQDPTQYPNIDCWLPEVGGFVGQPGDGAKGIRPYGKLIYEVNKQDVRNKIQNIYNQLLRTPDDDLKFYLIAGLSGGTGSGMFLPLSFDLQDWGFYQPGQTGLKFYSFLVLPPLQMPIGAHPRYHQNAYAALKELNYYNLQDSKRPYDNCYVIEPRNQNGTQILLNTLPLIIAQRIFLNIQEGQASTFAASVMDNAILGELGEDNRAWRHSRAFSSFGISAVSYPREIAAQCLSYKLSAQIVSRWLLNEVQTTEINADVQKTLPSVLLSYAHIIRDANPFDDMGTPNGFKTEIENSVKESLDKLQPRDLHKSNKIRESIESEFRGAGIDTFYTQSTRDVERAANLSILKLKAKLSEFLLDQNLGLGYTNEFIHELLEILGSFRTDIGTDLFSAAWQKREGDYREALREAIASISLDERKATYNLLGKEFVRNSNTLNEELNRYLSCKVGIRAGKYGAALLEKVIKEVGIIRLSINDWQVSMAKASETLNGLTLQILKDLASGVKENGKAIFTEPELNRLVSQIDQDALSHGLTKNLAKNLSQKVENLDLLVLSQTSDPYKLVYKSIYEWVVGQIKFQDIQLYDKFIVGQPDSRERQVSLKQAEKLSSPFVLFSPQETNRITSIVCAEQKIATVPDKTGGTQINGQTNKDTILQDLTKATGVYIGNGAIESPDNERIVFLEEILGFPLRFIELVKQLKKSYDSFPQPQILHIDKRIQASLYDLYLLSVEEEKKFAFERSEEAFVISRAYGWTLSKVNQATGMAEIRYEFKDERLHGIITKIVVGSNWDSTFSDFLLSNSGQESENNANIQDASKKMIEKWDNLRQLAQTDEKVRKEIPKKLSNLLMELQNEYDLGVDDERYEKYINIVNRIINCLGA